MNMKDTCCCMFFVLFFLCFSINNNLSEGADSITANLSLSGSQTIVSSGNTFELGFFNLGSPSRYYIGIWYKNVSQRTIVWVANRETPISNTSSAELKISEGNLVLLDSQVSFWSTSVSSTTSKSVVATLGDDGNLVLRDGSKPTSTERFWQSFDNPTDTFLPGGKLAYDKRTNEKQILTSWKNSEDPSLGPFSLELNPNESQYVITRSRSRKYWTSGAWNGHIFSLVPEMRLNYIFNFSYVDNVNETYFTYSLYNSTIISKLVMDVSGQIKQISWSEQTKEWNLFWSQPRQQCEVYAYCGEFGICNQNSLPFCSCLPGFKPKSEYHWNLTDFSDVRSAGECESICLNICSCTAYSYNGNECLVWNVELLGLQQLSEDDGTGRTIYIRLAASAPQFLSTKKNKGVPVGAIVGSVAVVTVLLAIVGVVIRRRRRHILGTAKAVMRSSVAYLEFGRDNKNDTGVPFCSWKSILAATENFSDVHKIGRGGFGPVYKVLL
ncbi:unnamed protein product [Fraxinus pennsylvanica]|uniref:Uncharacterized protein n=1 Tax=Fraxinus pennsylvanica TaxID=56036 RepID=A0AAD2E2P1_9LAMI|nr:unnamed protein product [Fraxinus pennsylvanica]